MSRFGMINVMVILLLFYGMIRAELPDLTRKNIKLGKQESQSTIGAQNDNFFSELFAKKEGEGESVEQMSSIDGSTGTEKSKILLHKLFSVPLTPSSTINEMIYYYKKKDLPKVIGGTWKNSTSLKKRMKKKALATHPDKSNHPYAGYAFSILKLSYDTLSKEHSEKKYYEKRRKRRLRKMKKIRRTINAALYNLQSELERMMHDGFQLQELRGWTKQQLGTIANIFRYKLTKISYLNRTDRYRLFLMNYGKALAIVTAGMCVH